MTHDAINGPAWVSEKALLLLFIYIYQLGTRGWFSQQKAMFPVGKKEIKYVALSIVELCWFENIN